MYRYNLGISFEEIVGQYSDNIALKFDEKNITSYGMLNNKVNQLARYLLDVGVGQGDVVCISGDKKVTTFACMIACLKIGAIYTILDPENPVVRLRKIMITCLPKVLFIDRKLEQKLQEIIKELNVAVVNNEPEELEARVVSYNVKNLSETQSVTGSISAYIMYTSGSTGFPKGAVMTHENVLNLIAWSIGTFNISCNDILTNVNPLYFDNLVFDFYSSLFSGACLVPFSKEIVTDSVLLVDMIDQLGCTSWFSVPSLLIYLSTMKVFDIGNMKKIKRIIFGGEGYPKPKLKKLFDIYSNRIEFINVYGPTECTCICSSYKISEDDFEGLQGFPPLGRMIDNFSYLILDENSRKVSDNEVGELCLLGPNVGSGYYNDPERTEVSFVQNPYNTRYKEIMYKTGDLVKYILEDDKIHIIGRKDNQIKHMGYRIELEEIETAMSCLDYVSQAVALHGEHRGLSQIVAVINVKSKIDEKTVRCDLKQIIPNYMIPTVFHIIKEELPKNPNGKVDRRKLSEIYLQNNLRVCEV